MGDRGRKPAAEMSLAADNTEKMAQRPPAPDYLTPEQAEVWNHTVNSMAADWFRPETLDVLAQYCRHVVTARHVASQISDMEGSAEEFNIREYALLLRCQKMESEAILSTATKLRITLQSTYDKSKKKVDQTKRPWEK